METTQNIWIIIATYIGPALLGFLTVWFQHRKNKADLLETIARAEKAKAEAEKLKKEGASTEGDIFLKWTVEFRTRLAEVEKRNNEFAVIIKEQGDTIDNQNDRIAEQDKIIANQSVLLIDANARIILLEKENSDLKTLVIALQKENSILRGCEEQNARDISTINNEQ